jgi:hypothetical protein
VKNYTLRPDELRNLEDACREADLVDTLSAGLVGADLTVKGSMGPSVANPLFAEVRQHRSTFASLMKQCWFCDELIEPVVDYHGPKVLAKGAYVCVHSRACKERPSKLPFHPDRVMYDSPKEHQAPLSASQSEIAPSQLMARVGGLRSEP